MNTGIAEIDLIFALSLMLAFGFALARLANLIHLPEVTGYLIAGIILGPSGVGLITTDALDDLMVFMNMAIVLIAFSIGEGCDFRQLRPLARILKRISPIEIGLTFVLSAVALVLGAYYLGLVEGPNALAYAFAVALICAAVATETSAPVTMAVVRECGATGSLTRILTSLMVLNSVATIVLFGSAVAIAHVLVDGWGEGLLTTVAFPFYHVIGALIIGFLAGTICDLVVHRLGKRSEVLVVALATIFFCGGLAFQLGLSAILAGVGAGIAVVNRDRRDVRAFRVAKDFDPPLYALFFTLAGVGVHIGELASAGVLVLIFVVARAIGKVGGTMAGARMAELKHGWGQLLGAGLLAQAGLSISLAVLVAQDPVLQPIAALTVNLIIASNIINVMMGPPLTRYALVHSGEAHALADDEVSEEGPAHTADEHLIIDTVPWIWPKLQPPMQPEGSVVVGLGHPDTAPALSRLGVLLAHNFAAGPTAVYVSTTKSSEDFWAGAHDDEALALFRLADAEAAKMGYSLLTEVAFADEVPDGIVKVANEEDAHLIVIGRTDTKNEEQFSRTVSTLAREADCPVVVAKFVGPLHTERMLVPVQDEDDYRIVQPIVEALAGVGEHTITLLHMMPPEAAPSELEEGQAEMMDWPGVADLPGQVICKAVSVEARVQEIADAAETTDIVIMPSRGRSGLRRLLFGSLSDDVAKATSTSMLVVVRATPPADAELEQYQSI